MATFESLRKLETKIKKSYNRAKKVEFFFETKMGRNYEEKWRIIMIELRGWDSHRWDKNGNDLTKQSWIEYCGKSIHPYYSLGDVCA